MESQPLVELDSEGNAVLVLERKSVQPYKTQDEYLYAMKEDLADWFNTLYKRDIEVDSFFDHLETGVLLCEHANNVNDFITEHVKDFPNPDPAKIQYRASNVRPGSFQCRDNISNFINWCRWLLNIPDTLLFESDDLVMRKNERNVVLCVLEVARRGARYGMLAPILVQLEKEIDAELAGEKPPPVSPPPQQAVPQEPQKQRKIDMRSLDEMVRDIAMQCTCPDQFPIVRISEGKYKVGESQTLIFVRILRNHVMVRIGGGWDTLENYLNRHDPCRCNAAKNHKNSAQRGTYQTFQPSTRRPSTTNSSNLQAYDVTTSRQLPATHSAPPDDTTTKIDSPRTPQISRRNSAVSGSRVDSLRKSDPDYSRPQSPTSVRRSHSAACASAAKRPQSALSVAKRPSSPLVVQGQSKNIPADQTRRPRRHSLTSGALHKQFSSNSDLTNDDSDAAFKKPEVPLVVKPQPKRPQSAGPRAHSRTSALAKAASSSSGERGRSPARTSTDGPHQARSRSVGASEVRKHLGNTFSVKSSSSSATSHADLDQSADVLIISRNQGGHHIISSTDDTDIANMSLTNGSSRLAERPLSSARVRITGERQILPNKPMIRSQSGDSRAVLERDSSDDSSGSNVSDLIQNGGYENRCALRRQTSISSVGSVGSTIEETIADCPIPEPNPELNQHMEMLFDEYLRIEKGVEESMAKAAACSSAGPRKTSGSSSHSSTGRRLPASPAPSRRATNQGPGSRKISAPGPVSGRVTPTQGPRRASLSASSSNSSLSSSVSSGYVPPPAKTQFTNGRATPPGTPGSNRRTVGPVRPVPIRPTAVYAQPVASPANSYKPVADNHVSRSSSVRRSSQRSSTPQRSQTPTPETSTPQVRVPARCKTPVVKMKTDEVKSRIDTGLGNRSVSRSSSQRAGTPNSSGGAAVRRSSSLSRAAILKKANTDLNMSTPRPRSRSREDLLDADDGAERRSRADVARKRDVLHSSGRGSVSRDERRVESPSLIQNGHMSMEKGLECYSPMGFLTGSSEARRTLPATPNMEPVTVQIPADLDESPTQNNNSGSYMATPRKDDRYGPRTRIPRPTSAQAIRIPGSESAEGLGTLKRFDSGVDINISPTDTGSYSMMAEDADDKLLHWPKHHMPEGAVSLSPQNLASYAVPKTPETNYCVPKASEAVSLAPQNLAYTLSNGLDDSDEYY